MIILLALPLLGGVALASSVYPSDLEAAVGSCKPPPCVVCHETNGGGGGTVTRAFGQALMARGLTGGSNSDLLNSSLDQLATDAVDSDGDGTTDWDELAAGSDPNPGGVAFCDQLSPIYGCVGAQASVVPYGAEPAAAGALLLAGMLVVARRRR